MIRKYKGKPLTVPLAASVIAFGLALSAGCDEKSTTHTSSSTHTVSPKGNVMGTVQDTNGAPVAGATVNLGGKTTKTDAQGQYAFANVPVTRVVGTDGGPISVNPLQIVIVPPTGSTYIGATVTVDPVANIEGQNLGDGANNGGGNGTQTTQGTHLISGFSVQAGTAVLSAKAASVKGVLRNALTGEPVTSTKMAMDLEACGSGAATGQEQDQDGVTTTYNAPVMLATTGADGSFSFANVPADCTLRLSAEDWDLDGGVGTDKAVATDDEDTVRNLGTVDATPITSLDNIEPVIVKVNESVGLVLNLNADGEVDQVVAVLSETVSGDLSVPGAAYATVDGVYAAGTFSIASGKTIVFVPETPIAEGAQIVISVLRSAVRDTAGNYLDDESGVAALDALFTADYRSGNGNEYVQFGMFAGSNPVGSAVTLAQLTGNAVGGDAQLLGVEDNLTGDDDTDIDHLNSDDDDDSNNYFGYDDDDAHDRIDYLLSEAGLGNINSTTYAEVQWAITNSVDYYWELLPQNGDAWRYDDGNLDNGDADDDGNLTVALGDARPGDLFRVTATDALGAQFTTVIELRDHVAPIPVIQDAYVYQNVLTSDSVFYGDGSEVVGSNGGNTQVGPVFAVNRALLSDPTIYASRGGSARDARNFPFGDFVVGTETILTQDDYDNFTGDVAYEAGTAIQSWLASRSVQMGIAFSEDIELVGTPSYSGAASISGWMVKNDIDRDFLGNTVNVDLAVFTANPVSMQADHGDTFDFEGAVADLWDNEAPSTNVIVHDLLPPFVIDGAISGDGASYDPLNLATLYDDVDNVLTLTFNEALAPNDELDGKTIYVRGENGNVKASLTLDFSAGGNAERIADTGLRIEFVGGFVDGDQLGETSGPSSRIDYYTVDFSEIADAVMDTSGNYNNYWGVHGGWLGNPHAIIGYRQ